MTHNTREVEDMVTHLLMATNAYGYFSEKGITSLRHELSEYLHHQPQKARQDWLRSEIEKLEGIKEEIEKLEKEHHEQFLADENRYKFDPSVRNLEVMKLHEGSTSAYARGLSWGKIEALTSIITRYKEELLELDRKEV